MHEMPEASRGVDAHDRDAVHEVGDAASIREPHALQHRSREAIRISVLSAAHRDFVKRITGERDARAPCDCGHLFAENLGEQLLAQHVDGNENDSERYDDRCRADPSHLDPKRHSGRSAKR